MRLLWTSLAVCLLGASCSCRPAGLTPVELTLRITPSPVDFGRPWNQTTAQRTVLITNTSRGSISARVNVEGGVFLAETDSLDLPPGDTTLVVTASSAVPGTEKGTLSLVVADQAMAVAPLTVTFVDPPPCGDASECSTFRFDRATSQCLLEPKPDGRACGAADRCLINGRCVSGECLGEAVACDDENPCTIDVCDAVGGCSSLLRVCPNPSACLVGVCDRVSGACESVPVADGVRCGDIANTSCTAVDICVNGQCVERDPPEGFACAPSTPCQGEGRCEAEVCVRPPATPLVPRWSVGAPQPDGGPSPDIWHDVFFESGGGVVLSSYFATPAMVQAPVGPRLPSTARRCLAWNALVVCADTPGQAVTAYDASTGATVWAYQTVLGDLPSLALPDWETFLARLVVMGPRRLGVVFESRRAEMGRDTNCRRFSLAVLDENGKRVVARLLDDPIFSTCNHPHSYGVAADPQGNVFFAFTPSMNVSPALPDPDAAGTVIVAYSPAGVRRWRHFIPGMPGGEIAVGRGLITVEAGRSIYDSARGVEVDAFSMPFGEGLISRDWVAAGPKGVLLELRRPGEGRVVTLESPDAQRSRSGLRGATWQGAPVALRFASSDAGTALEAFPLSPYLEGTVRPTWRCEVTLAGDPVSFELKPDGIAAMTDPQAVGAGLCENCDPPWAGTRARFFEVDVPGLRAPSMPWPGPWGGAQHDHQED